MEQRILLVRPKPDSETIGLQHVMICEPLELEYLAANLAAPGRQIEILDMILERRGLESLLRRHRPDFLLMSGYITHVDVIKDYARRAKKLLPACRVFVGGVHAEVVPEDFADPCIEGILRANAIPAMRRILDGAAPGTLAEVWGNTVLPEKTAPLDLLPPDRDSTARYRSRYYYMFHNPCALMKTSFGCPYQCTFCFCRHITDGKYWARPVADLIAELASIPEREIYFVDDDFLFDASRIGAFLDALEASGLDKRFLVYGRADFVAANAALIARFAALGLRAVIVGLESPQDEELDQYNKRSGEAENREAIRILNACGVEVYGTLILPPEYDREDFRRLGDWLLERGINFVNLQPLTPLPGTPLLAEYRDRLIIPQREHAKWDLAHLVIAPQKLSIREYYLQILRLYHRVVGRPEHARRLVERYGFGQVLKLWLGSNRVSWQYLVKAIKGGRP